MRALVFILLFFLSSSSFAAGSAAVCLLRDKVTITQVDGAIDLAGRPPRLASIPVNILINCRSGVVLVPRDTAEAVAWLDASLPLDLKASLLSGDYAEPYATSNYGASVMEDLFRYFTSQWMLKNDSSVCNSPNVRQRILSDTGPCFYALIDILREAYLSGAGQR